MLVMQKAIYFPMISHSMIRTPFKYSCILVIAVCALTSLTGGCATTPKSSMEISHASKPDSDPARDVEQRLRTEAMLWENTPHRMGGTTQRGIDCSGLVMVINQKLFGIDLPRTTKDQARSGTPISRSRLQAGDLVFFQPPEYKRHVGIYLGRGEFLHASSSNGVMISNIHDPYWQKSFWTARRIFPM